ncbi:MAG TPA: response regulator [Polyangiaceae bacterium]|nr:response regulator [Polyangiaceae bacterium]
MSTRVLVVDDSPTIRKVVVSILGDRGYETAAAENGEDALEKLREERFDLVLTDFVMPKMNGYQFCREVRGDASLKDLPIVLMSAKGDKIRGQFVQQTGAMDAITKPFDPLALVAVIENALARHESQPPRAEETPPSSDRKRAAEPPSLELPPMDLVLSDDPGLRRNQVAFQFATALGRMVLPSINGTEGVPSGLDDKISAGIRKAVTPERLGKLAVLLRTLDFGADARIILSGDLSCISIAEVLQMLELQRQTGALGIASANAEITLYVRDGLLDLAQGRGLPNSFRLGRYLVQTGALTKEELSHFLDNRAGSKRLIGDALVQLDMVTEAQVKDALKLQTSEMVYEVVGWKQGRFVFTRDATCPEATLTPLAIAPGGMVMEGFRRVDEWRLIEGSFDFDDTLQRDPIGSERATAGDLTDTERAVLEAVNGERTVRQIVDDVNASTFDVCKILYQLLNSHLVRRKAA